MFSYESRGCLAANTRARDVVDGIAGDGQNVANQFWGNLPFRRDLSFAEKGESILWRGKIGLCCGVNFHFRPDQLIEILVVGRENYLDAPFAGGEDIAPHEIVSL